IEQVHLRRRFRLLVRAGQFWHHVSPASRGVRCLELATCSDRCRSRAHRTWLTKCCPLTRQTFIPRLGDCCAVFAPCAKSFAFEMRKGEPRICGIVVANAIVMLLEPWMSS